MADLFLAQQNPASTLSCEFLSVAMKKAQSINRIGVKLDLAYDKFEFPRHDRTQCSNGLI